MMDKSKPKDPRHWLIAIAFACFGVVAGGVVIASRASHNSQARPSSEAPLWFTTKPNSIVSSAMRVSAASKPDLASSESDKSQAVAAAPVIPPSDCWYCTRPKHTDQKPSKKRSDENDWFGRKP